MNIEFIIGTYNRPYHLTTLIGSIFTQTSPNWRIHVIADGHHDGFDKVKEFYSFDSRIRFSVIDGPNNDWGNTPRILYGREQCQEEWMVMTGDDNYYSPFFVESVFAAIDDNTNFVFCNMLQGYNHFETSPAPFEIDLGSYVTRTKLAKQIEYEIKNTIGDGIFAKKYYDTFCKQGSDFLAKKIHGTLYVHN